MGLSGRDLDEVHFAIFDVDVAALVQSELGFDLVHVVLHHVVDDPLRRSFFTGLDKQDDVPVQFDARPLDHQHDLKGGCDHPLVVGRPTTVDEAIPDRCRKRVHGPLIPIHSDHIGMPHDQERPLAPVSSETGDQIPAFRVQSVDLAWDSLTLKQRFRVLGHPRLVTWRVRRVEPDKVLENCDRVVASPVKIRDLRLERNRCPAHHTKQE